MADNATQAPPLVAASTSTTSTTTVVPATNPLLEPKNLMEVGGFVLMVAGVFALIERRAKDRRKEDADNHKLTHDAVDKSIHRLANEQTTDRARIHVLEQKQAEDVQRIVALEINMANFKDGQARIEHQLEKMEKDSKEGRAEIIDSLRELREVKPRS